MTTNYAVIPAEGHYGDYAIVVSTHGSLSAAQRAARGNWQPIACPEYVRKGSRILRGDIQSGRSY